MYNCIGLIIEVSFCLLELIKITMNKLQESNPSSSYSRRDKQHSNRSPIIPEDNQPTPSPIKYLLQNNIRLNAGEGERPEEEIEVISELLKGCTLFYKLKIDVSDKSLMKGKDWVR